MHGDRIAALRAAADRVAQRKRLADAAEQLAALGGEWVPAAGFSRYAVSDHGLVLSFRRKRAQLVRPRFRTNGRYAVTLTNDAGQPEVVELGGLVLVSFGVARPQGAYCKRRDNDLRNNHLSNLYWTDYGWTRVPREAVLELARQGLSQSAIARELRVHHTSVSRVLNAARREGDDVPPGRKPRAEVTGHTRAAVLSALQSGFSARTAAELAGVSLSTVDRIKRAVA